MSCKVFHFGLAQFYRISLGYICIKVAVYCSCFSGVTSAYHSLPWPCHFVHHTGLDVSSVLGAILKLPIYVVLMELIPGSCNRITNTTKNNVLLTTQKRSLRKVSSALYCLKISQSKSTGKFFMQLVLQRLKVLHCSCTDRVLHCAMGLPATRKPVTKEDRGEDNKDPDWAKHCETSCWRGVVHCATVIQSCYNRCKK